MKSFLTPLLCCIQPFLLPTVSSAGKTVGKMHRPSKPTATITAQHHSSSPVSKCSPVLHAKRGSHMFWHFSNVKGGRPEAREALTQQIPTPEANQLVSFILCTTTSCTLLGLSFSIPSFVCLLLQDVLSGSRGCASVIRIWLGSCSFWMECKR